MSRYAYEQQQTKEQIDAELRIVKQMFLLTLLRMLTAFITILLGIFSVVREVGSFVLSVFSFGVWCANVLIFFSRGAKQWLEEKAEEVSRGSYTEKF